MLELVEFRSASQTYLRHLRNKKLITPFGEEEIQHTNYITKVDEIPVRRVKPQVKKTEDEGQEQQPRLPLRRRGGKDENTQST